MASPKPELRSVAFRNDRQESWQRLEKLVSRVERQGIGALGQRDLVDLPTLHRAAVSSLSVARAISLDRSLLAYLEALTARSHFAVYGLRRDLRRAFREFVAVTFPAAVRAARWHLLLAFGVLLIGVLTGFAVTIADPELYDGFVSPDMAQGRDMSATEEDLLDVLYSQGSIADGLTSFASFLFQHNTQVGFFCFALGFAAGVPVLYLMLFNGLLLGAMAALHHLRGLSPDFWGWILPHGVTELLAVALCGAAGLLQGHAVLLPGRQSRPAALRAAGRQAGSIVLGSIALFAIAAVIEGFFRQLVQSITVRYTLAGLTAALWIGYFGFCGRTRR